MIGDRAVEFLSFEKPIMKYYLSLILCFFVLLLLSLQEAPAGHPSAQSREPDGINLSPEAWPPGELEKYQRLQKNFMGSTPVTESRQGMVAVTMDALAARIGLEALRQGGSAADAALAAALAQITLEAGATVSYA